MTSTTKRKPRGAKARQWPGTRETLLSVVTYNPETGDMNAIGPFNVRPYKGPGGQMLLRLPTTEDKMGRGKREAHYYRIDHLAWLAMTGQWPSGYIEHIDDMLENNAIENLVHIDDAGVRWWFGAQAGLDERELVRVEGTDNDNTKIDVYHDGNTNVFKPRVAEGWVNKLSEPRPEDQIEPDTGLEKGEFGLDWS